MTSEVEICNLALGNIRAASINSLNENSTGAQQCKLRYPILRDQMLQDSPWQFSRSLKPLSLTTEEIFNWVYVYQYPSDCLHINRLLINYPLVDSSSGIAPHISRYYDRGLPMPNLTSQVDYKVYNIDDNKLIGANEAELRIDYRKRITDPNLFSMNFIMALSHLLASQLAVPLVSNEGKGRAMVSDNLQLYERYLKAGISNELNEQHTHTPDSDFISVRT